MCLECLDGFWLQSDGTCKPCAETLHHCSKCRQPDVCDLCDSEVATSDINGRCTNCVDNKGWVADPGN